MVSEVGFGINYELHPFSFTKVVDNYRLLLQTVILF